MKTAHWAAAVLLAAGCTHASSPAAVSPTSPSSTPAVTSSASATPSLTTTPTTAPTPSPTAVPHTRLRQVRPVTASGHLARGYRIVTRDYGADCHPGSEAIGTAYRCFAGHTVYDPCWRYATQAPTVAVLCLSDPFSRDVTALTTGHLDPTEGVPPRVGDPFPWGLRLSDGSTCDLEQGAHDNVHGRVVDYGCGGVGTLAVLRGLHQDSPLWTADTARWTGTAYEPGPTLTVTTAVYGRA